MVFEKQPPITSLLTLPETNIAPEDGPSQTGNNRLPIIHFQVANLLLVSGSRVLTLPKTVLAMWITHGWGIDPDIFFDDDGKVWYVGTAAPAKPNFPGEGGGGRNGWNTKDGAGNWFESEKREPTKNNQKTRAGHFYRLMEWDWLLEFLPFFLFGCLYFFGSEGVTKNYSDLTCWGLFAFSPSLFVPRGDLLPCWGPQSRAAMLESTHSWSHGGLQVKLIYNLC